MITLKERNRLFRKRVCLDELLRTQTDFQSKYLPLKNIPISSLSSAIAREAMEIWAASGKWWYNSNPLDMEKIKEESIDILHFLLELWLKLEMDGNEIAELYDKKMQINIQRQESRYIKKTGDP